MPAPTKHSLTEREIATLQRLVTKYGVGDVVLVLAEIEDKEAEQEDARVATYGYQNCSAEVKRMISNGYRGNAEALRSITDRLVYAFSGGKK